ncbi:MAG: hypothetical protein AB7O80_11680 [Acetobacteraceae bacterium]
MKQLHLLPALALAACTTIPDAPTDNVWPGVLTWYLPKMTAKASVDLRLESCEPGEDGLPMMDITGKIEAKPIADLTQRRSLPVENLIGWTTNNEVTVELYPNGTLKSLGAKSDDKTAAIIGDVVQTAAKIAPAFASTAAGRVRAMARFACTSDTAARIAELRRLRRALLRGALDTKATDATSAAIGRLEAALTITISKSVKIDDKGPPTAGYAQTENLARVTYKDLVEGKWFAPGSVNEGAEVVLIDAKWGDPPISKSFVQPTPDQDYQYREPLPVRLSITMLRPGKDNGGQPSQPETIASQTIAVAQWGRARRLPLSAPLLTSLEWGFTFAEDGSLTQAKVTTTARGTALSGLAATATDAALDARKAVRDGAAANSEVNRLKAQNDLYDAKIDNINKANTLRGLGGSP